jgi:predicted amidophosphoribosyltransferase
MEAGNGVRSSKCSAETSEGNRFCGDCGAALANRCPRCGADNPAGKRFCGDCGARWWPVVVLHRLGVPEKTRLRPRERAHVDLVGRSVKECPDRFRGPEPPLEGEFHATRGES